MHNIPHSWRLVHNGAVNIFDPAIAYATVMSVRCDVTKGTGPWYRWGIKLKLDNGGEISLRGDGTHSCEESMLICDAAYPLVLAWADTTPRPGQYWDGFDPASVRHVPGQSFIPLVDVDISPSPVGRGAGEAGGVGD